MNNNTINLLALALLGLVNAGCVTHTHHRPYTTSYVETGYVTPGYGAATHTAPAVVETIYVEEPVYIGGPTMIIDPPHPPPPRHHVTPPMRHPHPIQSAPVARPPVHQKPNPPAVAPKPQPAKPALKPGQPTNGMKPGPAAKPQPTKPAVTPKPQPTKPMVTAKPQPNVNVKPNRTANAASAARSRPANEHQGRRNGHGQGEHKRPSHAFGERRPRH